MDHHDNPELLELSLLRKAAQGSVDTEAPLHRGAEAPLRRWTPQAHPEHTEELTTAVRILKLHIRPQHIWPKTGKIG